MLSHNNYKWTMSIYNIDSAKGDAFHYKSLCLHINKAASYWHYKKNSSLKKLSYFCGKLIPKAQDVFMKRGQERV